MAVDLPYPLTKPASSSRMLRLSMELPFEDGLGRLSYGDDVSSVVQFSVHDGQLGVRRGEVKMGGGVARLPEDDGISLSGTLPYLSADEYRKWMVSLSDGATRSARDSAGKEGGMAHGGDLKRINLRLDKLDVVGRQLSNVVLNAEKEVDHWQLQLASDEVAGVIQLSDSPTQPLVMDLDYIKLARVADDTVGDTAREENVSEEGESADPRQLPPLQIDSKRFIYDGHDFGQLALRTSRHPVGLRVEKVGLISRHMVVTAHGTWIVVNGKQSSSFNVLAQTDDLGDTLELLGFKKSIRGGEGKGSALLSWPGSPAQFSAKGLDGTLNIKLEDGVVVDVEPGAGRLFGLFSFQALPRRLILDFSDLFSSGFEFDKIKGSFSIEDGNAYTSDLFMQGTAAEITIEGRVGLGKKDYDQIVTVTPEISSTLPVIGALLSSVNVGAAVWALQRVFAPDLDEDSQVKYRVSGSWNDPQVEPLR
ncbi:MAG: hypothetical protein GXP10_05940 [Gammaproteobacteria bacterium]|nr:hypothetical protein [Gammaproteobacteria bacterium]